MAPWCEWFCFNMNNMLGKHVGSHENAFLQALLSVRTMRVRALIPEAAEVVLHCFLES